MTLALIDGDIIVYKAACAAEKEVRWPDGVWTYTAKEQDGFDIFERKLDDILKALKTDNYVICLSDQDGNFRKEVDPEYKANRKDIRRPLLLKALREYAMRNHKVAMLPRLEADDVMGIMATDPKLKDRPVIVTLDKDLSQIPVDVYNFDTKKLSKAEHRNPEKLFLTQVLTGDVTDNYPGCPGIGAETAETILSNPMLMVPYEHVMKSGPRKGTSELRWKAERPCTMWEAVVSQYDKAGMTINDALKQARLARILQYSDYENDEVKLWGGPND